MRLLVLGLSNLVRRRVLPALEEVGGLDAVDIATHSGAARLQRPEPLAGETFDDYDVALRRSEAEVAYVSLVNSEHGPWVRKALESGRHVVVDKPAFLGLEETERTLSLAGQRDRCLAEATVWGYHPQVDLMKRAFEEAASEPARISAAFSVPPLDAANFRYCRSLGGGSLWDQGPYAVSIGRVFFGGPAETVDCHVLSAAGPDNVETAFSMLATYPGGRAVAGHFGFDTAYRNHIDILSPDLVLEADRVFTIPADAENEMRLMGGQGPSIRTAPPGDSFSVFFECVLEAIRRHEWGELTADLLSDAQALQRLRDSAGVV